MAELTHVAFRKLGGESEAVPLTPPWFLPGADAVWGRIAEVERLLRHVVRDVYTARFGDRGPERIESALPQQQRETLTRALRSRPSGADPLSVVDYLYLAQLPTLLFTGEAQQETRSRLSATDAKKRLLTAFEQIVPVRNEIAHVREVSQDRLLKANVACGEVLGLFE